MHFFLIIKTLTFIVYLVLVEFEGSNCIVSSYEMLSYRVCVPYNKTLTKKHRTLLLFIYLFLQKCQLRRYILKEMIMTMFFVLLLYYNTFCAALLYLFI